MKTITFSKGYRLKPDTHELIEKVRQELNCTKEKVLREAINFYYSEMKKSNINNKK